MDPSEPPLSPALTCPSPVSAAEQELGVPRFADVRLMCAMSDVFLCSVTLSTLPDPEPSVARSLSPEERERYDDIDTYLQDTHIFDSTIDSRKVKTNQRLRSLALDATKTWTRPGGTRAASAMS